MPQPRRNLSIVPDPPPLLEAGRDAVRRGAWAEATETFERLLATEPDPEVAAEAWAGIELAG